MFPSYVIPLHDRFLHDHSSHEGSYAADVLAASGDLFITLATQLDELTHLADTTRRNPVLEDMIRTLIYLQRHYEVVKKQANYRQ